MSNPVRPHRRQPTRLPHSWDSWGKNTGAGCHFLLQCVKVKSESEVAQSYLTRSGPMGCSLPGSSVHGIFQARVLEWDAIAFSKIQQQELINSFQFDNKNWLYIMACSHTHMLQMKKSFIKYYYKWCTITSLLFSFTMVAS